jgi:hypothetical protein
VRAFLLSNFGYTGRSSTKERHYAQGHHTVLSISVLKIAFVMAFCIKNPNMTAPNNSYLMTSPTECLPIALKLHKTYRNLWECFQHTERKTMAKVWSRRLLDLFWPGLSDFSKQTGNSLKTRITVYGQCQVHSWRSYLKLKMAVFWDVAPYSLVENDQRFRGAYCLHHQCKHSKRLSVSTRLHDATSQKTSHLHTRHRENLKSHLLKPKSRALYVRV